MPMYKFSANENTSFEDIYRWKSATRLPFPSSPKDNAYDVYLQYNFVFFFSGVFYHIYPIFCEAIAAEKPLWGMSIKFFFVIAVAL